MTIEELREKARSLPLAPGVYLMSNKSGTIIYVGKAKKLRNRVIQYFQDTASHTLKTRMMVSQVDHFDVIIARSEFEALVLECSLIKRHMPKYNILLKDDKGFPYIRLDRRQVFPTMSLSARVYDDGASYYGPFGSRSATQKLIDAIRLALKLPGCSKHFPQDQGKERPCLNFQLGNCSGWCRPEMTAEKYSEITERLHLLLSGRYQEAAAEIREKMTAFADNLQFEQAAVLRDQLKAIESLAEHQLVTAGTMADTDVIGWAQTASKACFSVLHYAGGNLIDKDYELLGTVDNEAEALSSLVKQYYLSRGAAPRIILLPMPMEDAELFSELLMDQLGRRVYIRIPQRGDNARLLDIANANAREEAERVTTRTDHAIETLQRLQKMLGLSEPLSRMESYDISNLAGTDIVASMVVFKNGQASRKDYRRFRLKNMEGQDDYGSMRQVLRRRFTRLLEDDPGFSEKPDLLLIDGGQVHAETVRSELESMGITDIPIFGMVKDGRHRTRALLTPQGHEINISAEIPVFSLIGRMQEETHRFAITYNRSLRSRRLKHSELDEIPGIGPKRRELLLKHFHSIAAIRDADLTDLEQVLPHAASLQVYEHFHPGSTAVT